MPTFYSSPKTLTNNERQDFRVDSTGALAVSTVGSDGQPGTALPGGTDRSGSVTTGGTAQLIAAVNTARRGLTFQNTSDTEMRITESGSAATATTGYLVAPGGRVNISTNRAISMFCATTGKTFAATEW